VASNSDLLAFVDAKLAYEIDVGATSRAQTDGTAVIVDTRKQLSWDHGHIVGAMHLPADTMATLPRDRSLVVYCWGPGCNGATHTARRLLAEGFDVREMIGGTTTESDLRISSSNSRQRYGEYKDPSLEYVLPERWGAEET
jgi:rhodanese-related sulfurtransferase